MNDRSGDSLGRKPRLWTPVLLGLVLLLPGRAAAQGDGPRSQTLLPVGSRIIVPAYLRLSGDYDFTQTVLLPGAKVRSDIFVITYMRAFGIGGRYAQIRINRILEASTRTSPR